jgi:hypothetical protein
MRKLPAVVVFVLAGVAIARADLTDWGGDDCKGIATGDASYCRSDNCKAIAKHVRPTADRGATRRLSP